MEAYVILGFLFGFPLLIGGLFRVNTSHLFVSILAAEILERYFADEAILVLTPFISSEIVLSYVGFAMLILPVILTGIFLHGSLSRAKTLLHLVPFILSGIVFSAFAAPILPEAIQAEIASVPVGDILLDSAQFIVGVTVLLQLFALWFLTKSKKESKKKH
jgi:hypothetical protein